MAGYVKDLVFLPYGLLADVIPHHVTCDVHRITSYHMIPCCMLDIMAHVAPRVEVMIQDALSGHSDYFAPMWVDPAMQEKLEDLIPGWKGFTGLERHLVHTC